MASLGDTSPSIAQRLATSTPTSSSDSNDRPRTVAGTSQVNGGPAAVAGVPPSIPSAVLIQLGQDIRDRGANHAILPVKLPELMAYTRGDPHRRCQLQQCGFVPILMSCVRTAPSADTRRQVVRLLREVVTGLWSFPVGIEDSHIQELSIPLSEFPECALDALEVLRELTRFPEGQSAALTNGLHRMLARIISVFQHAEILIPALQVLANLAQDKFRCRAVLGAEVFSAFKMAAGNKLLLHFQKQRWPVRAGGRDTDSGVEGSSCSNNSFSPQGTAAVSSSSSSPGSGSSNELSFSPLAGGTNASDGSIANSTGGGDEVSHLDGGTSNEVLTLMWKFALSDEGEGRQMILREVIRTCEQFCSVVLCEWSEVMVAWSTFMERCTQDDDVLREAIRLGFIENSQVIIRYGETWSLGPLLQALTNVSAKGNFRYNLDIVNVGLIDTTLEKFPIPSLWHALTNRETPFPGEDSNSGNGVSHPPEKENLVNNNNNFDPNGDLADGFLMERNAASPPKTSSSEHNHHQHHYNRPTTHHLNGGVDWEGAQKSLNENERINIQTATNICLLIGNVLLSLPDRRDVQQMPRNIVDSLVRRRMWQLVAAASAPNAHSLMPPRAICALKLIRGNLQRLTPGWITLAMASNENPPSRTLSDASRCSSDAPSSRAL